jgi:OmpA-OmpF porin, OOP family
MDRAYVYFILGAYFICHFGSSAQAQKVLTYDFSNELTSYDSTAPALKVLGTEGSFVEEVLPELGNQKRTVYQFEANSGLQFNNNDAKGFLSGSYTVEVYFRLTDLGSWKRVLDFKNQKSDNGCYIYEGRLNFFNFATGEKAPVKPNEYVHYVFSRDAETHMIKMYVDGESKVEFRDPGDEAVLGSDQVLNFFQDDLIAKNEASAGAVALIRLYDRVMTPVFIKRNFQQLSKSIQTPPRQVAAPEPTVVVSSKEVAKARESFVEVNGKIFNGRNLNAVQNVEVQARPLQSDSIVARTQAVNGAYSLMLPPNQSYSVTARSPGFEPRSIVVTPTTTQREVKTLFNMSEEKYDKPLGILPFIQSEHELTPQGQALLDSLIGYLSTRPDLRILLLGHTDNVGDFDKNVALSRERTAIVKSALLQKGVPASRISEQGYGSTRPVASNNTEATRQHNRRVEIWVEPLKR